MWGSTRIFGRKVKLGETITQAQAEEQFEKDLEYFEKGIKNLVKVPLNSNQFSALVSFAYNIGLAGLAGSTALKRLNKKDYVGAAEAMSWWTKGGDGKVLAGLVRRRAAERALFFKK